MGKLIRFLEEQTIPMNHYMIMIYSVLWFLHIVIFYLLDISSIAITCGFIGFPLSLIALLLYKKHGYYSSALNSLGSIITLLLISALSGEAKGIVTPWMFFVVSTTFFMCGPKLGFTTTFISIVGNLIIKLTEFDHAFKNLLNIHDDVSHLIGLDIYFFCAALFFTSVILGLNELIKALSKIKLDQKSNEVLRSAKLASLGELAAGIGHEINNPLAISVAHLEKVKKEIKLNPVDKTKLDSRLGKIIDANARIEKIVGKLRTYSRFDTNTNERVNVNEVLLETVDLVKDLYDKSDISINLFIKTENLWITGNIGEFQQVIINLISNAKDATESRDERIIEVSLSLNEKSQILLSVSDNGEGICEENKDKILDPFFTTKAVGKGTGLGLGIVTEILKKIDGKLEIESTVGLGSRFNIILPQAKS